MIKINDDESGGGGGDLIGRLTKLGGIFGGIMGGNLMQVGSSALPENSVVGKFMGAAKSILPGAGAAGAAAAATPMTDQAFKMPEIGEKFKGNAPSLGVGGQESGGAMGRAYEKSQQDPMFQIHQGMQHLNDTNFDLPFELKEPAFGALLEAKHYGKGGKR